MSNQKTAMQDLFGIIEKQIGKNFPQEIKDHFITMEKQQIKDAYNQGYREGEVQEYNSENDVSLFDDAENYYNRTYATS